MWLRGGMRDDGQARLLEQTTPYDKHHTCLSCDISDPVWPTHACATNLNPHPKHYNNPRPHLAVAAEVAGVAGWEAVAGWVPVERAVEEKADHAAVAVAMAQEGWGAGARLQARCDMALGA
jgi:hypothetical protein